MALNKSSPKISLFLPSLEIGGVERVSLNLAEGFARKGLYVDLVIAQAKGDYLKRIPQGVRVIDLKTSRVAASLLPLIKYIRTERPSCLIVGKEYAGIVAIMAKKLAGVPIKVLATIHTILSSHMKFTKVIRERIIIRCLARYLYPRADYIIAASNGIAKDVSHVLKIPLDQITVIYNPVVSDEFFIQANRPVSHPWFVEGSLPVIISIGRLTISKDYPTLITAFAKVRETRNVRLVIFGDGEERLRIESLIRHLELQNDIWMPGFVYPPYPFLARSSAFVLSSLWEGLPTVIIEALALGVSVVSTDCPHGPREILCDGKFGRLVPVRDSDALANGIIQILEHPDCPETLKTRAAIFSIESAVSRYLQVLGFID